jgi:hypothetical protein
MLHSSRGVTWVGHVVREGQWEQGGTFVCSSKFLFYCGSLDFIVNVKFVMHVLHVT